MRIISGILLVTLLFGCVPDDQKKEDSSEQEILNPVQENYGENIIVLLDLSNRVGKPKSVHDTEILAMILNKVPALFKQSIELQINPKLSVYSLNEVALENINRNSLTIDLRRFGKNEMARSDYMYRDPENGFQVELQRLQNEVEKVYVELEQTHEYEGADLFNHFKNELNTIVIDTNAIPGAFREVRYISKYRNRVILITDGYIEAGRYANDPTMREVGNPNRRRYFSEKFIEEFRQKYHSSSSNNLKQFFETNNFGIVPVENPLLNEVDLLVLELDDRSIKNGTTTQNPTDAEIMELFWEDWLEQNNFNSFTLVEKVSNTSEMDVVLTRFFELK